MKSIYALPAVCILAASAGTLAHFTLAQSSQPGVLLTQANPANNPASQSDRPPGGLFILSKDGQKQVFPLKHTDVKAKIAGNVSRTEVTQTFENPFDKPLEAIYVFPLPDEAAVDDMEIKIGDRIIKGDIKKREEAQKIYEQAIREGRTAGLLEQERDNIFTQSLANIKPGEQIDVTIRYTDSLKFEGGDYEFVFPMVVGPRYIPGNPIDGNNSDTDRVPDASRITPPVIKPGTRSGHDIGVTVEIDAGVPIKDVRSPSHKITSDRLNNITRIQLANEDTIPNKDLILRYQVVSDRTQATVLSQADNRGGHFAAYLIPAVEYKTNEIVPKDVVFLMDTSGSQSGDPLVKSKELMRRFINGLNPNDTFTIIDFANTTKQLSADPLPNTPNNRQQATIYIDQLQANGGTELLNGIRAVMNFPQAKEGRLRSVVLLTDGYIGNESEIIAEVQRELKSGNRLYSFGVGSSVNRFLLNRLAEVGRGTSQVIRQDEPTEEVAEKFFRQINNPVLTNVQISWEGNGEKPEIYPTAAPDLFANQPLVLFGRKQDGNSGKLRITGTVAGGKRYEKTLDVDFKGSGNSAIAQLWGRSRIKDLTNQMFGGETKSGVDAVTDTALAYRLLSQYTAFVAVSEEVRVSPDGTPQRVQVPVELPEGVSYEGIFGAADEEADGVGRIQGGYAPSSGRPMQPPSPLQQNLPSAPPPPSPSKPAEPKPEANQQQSAKRISIISADGLDESAIASLTQYLNSVNLPQDVSGEIVLEFPIRNGRVGRIVLDDKASTLQDKMAIDPIKAAIARWGAPSAIARTIRLKLRVNP